MTPPYSKPPPRRAGISLLEAAVLTSVVGVVLAALVPTFLREVRASKVSEASENLATLHKLTAAYYATHHRLPSGRRERHCLPERAGPTPPRPSPDPMQVDFGAAGTPGHTTWAALGFQPGQAVRYAYRLETESTGCGPRLEGSSVSVHFAAEGDLDGDGVLSTFARDAEDVDASGELLPVGRLQTYRRIE